MTKAFLGMLLGALFMYTVEKWKTADFTVSEPLNIAQGIGQKTLLRKN